jgi:hypothetical protein
MGIAGTHLMIGLLDLGSVGAKCNAQNTVVASFHVDSHSGACSRHGVGCGGRCGTENRG